MMARAALIMLTVMLFVGVGIYAVMNNTSNGSNTPNPAANTCVAFRDQEDTKVLPLGTKAPDFLLPDMAGQDVRLSDALKEKRVLVEMFASWCPHCQHSVPAVKKIQAAHPDDLTILAINAGDKPGEPSTSKAFQSTFHVTYPILESPARALMDDFCLQSFPTFYLINQDGTVAWHYTGTLDEDGEQWLSATLAGKPYTPKPLPKPEEAAQDGAGAGGEGSAQGKAATAEKNASGH